MEQHYSTSFYLLPSLAGGNREEAASCHCRRFVATQWRTYKQPVRLAGGRWRVLICSERKVLLAGCWWLVCSERKVLLASG
jgi:hypothetical protein